MFETEPYYEALSPPFFLLTVGSLDTLQPVIRRSRTTSAAPPAKPEETNRRALYFTKNLTRKKTNRSRAPFGVVSTPCIANAQWKQAEAADPMLSSHLGGTCDLGSHQVACWQRLTPRGWILFQRDIATDASRGSPGWVAPRQSIILEPSCLEELWRTFMARSYYPGPHAAAPKHRPS